MGSFLVQSADDSEQVLKFFEEEGGKFCDMTCLPDGYIQGDTSTYRMDVIKKSLIFDGAPRVDISNMRLTLKIQGRSPSAIFAKMVVFQPQEKIFDMIDRIEKKVHIAFEVPNKFNYDSLIQIPKWGFFIKDYGFYDWYRAR